MNIDKLEAGFDADKLIAEKAMGWKYDAGYWVDAKGGIRSLLYDFNPSTDIACAWEVVEKLDLFRRYFLVKEADNEWSIQDYDYDPGVFAVAETVPLVICKAALKMAGCENDS